MGLCKLDLKMYAKKGISNLKLPEAVDKNGAYDVYGASGLIRKIDFFHQGEPYVAIVKDGVGIGRTMLLKKLLCNWNL